jgi:hypothetical protein
MLEGFLEVTFEVFYYYQGNFFEDLIFNDIDQIGGISKIWGTISSYVFGIPAMLWAV